MNHHTRLLSLLPLIFVLSCRFFLHAPWCLFSSRVSSMQWVWWTVVFDVRVAHRSSFDLRACTSHGLPLWTSRSHCFLLTACIVIERAAQGDAFIFHHLIITAYKGVSLLLCDPPCASCSAACIIHSHSWLVLNEAQASVVVQRVWLSNRSLVID